MTVQPDMWIPPAKARNTTGPAKIVALGGDGIGPEVVDATLRCVEALDLGFEVSKPLHGKAALDAEGTVLPESTKAEIDSADAILFGAIDTTIGHAKKVLLYLRFDKAMYANVRPATSLPGIPSILGGTDTNLVIVRELTEGMYPGREGTLEELNSHWPEYKDRRGTKLPERGTFALRVVTPEAVTRIANFACRLATHRKHKGYGPGLVSIVHKSNVLQTTDGMFAEICIGECKKAGLDYNEIYVDEAARRLVVSPQEFDVIVTSNLFGDILSDVAAEAMGGMPMVPSCALSETMGYFEACHGSAPDIAGTGKANPSATILSGAMMLSYLGHPKAAARLIDATLSTIGSGIKTGDLGGTATTDSFTDAVCERLA